ncbi:hypothetical protein ACH5RR_016090 [Cinchona calisaya]|uniref:DUF8040 domain-containing protein n=1 Tax=Cinchona calisaya TaxID=153742 RepID=A0ABD2ZWZ0_9GENT
MDLPISVGNNDPKKDELIDSLRKFDLFEKEQDGVDLKDEDAIGLAVTEWGEFKEAAMGVTQMMKQRSKAGLGLVARNNSGKLMASWAVALDQSGEVSWFEAMAIRLALEKTKNGTMGECAEEESGNSGQSMEDNKMKQGSSGEKGKQRVKEVDDNLDVICILYVAFQFQDFMDVSPQVCEARTLRGPIQAFVRVGEIKGEGYRNRVLYKVNVCFKHKRFHHFVARGFAAPKVVLLLFRFAAPKVAMNSDDENAMVIGAATSVLATGYAVLEFYKIHEVVPRVPHVNKDKAREDYMDSILYRSRSYCIDQIRMCQDAFFQLLDTLTIRQLLQPTVHMSTREQLFLFLQIVGHNLRFRVIRGYLYRSTDTIHRYFFIVVNAILKLYPNLIHWPNHSTPPEILSNRKYYPWFAFVEKNYLVDAGYGIRNGFIPPYHGVRYHLQEYDDNPPQNEKELFNIRHSSLRTTIEQDFGVLKKRFRLLDNDPFWKYKTQVDVVLASYILHNHIVGLGLEPEPNDHGRGIQELVGTFAFYGYGDFMKNPTHDKYINKKIDMYNEMALVVGKDLATGSFAKGFTDMRLDALSTLDDTMDNTEEIPMENDIPSLAASTSGTKQHRKKSRSNDKIEKISEKLGEVAAALTKLSNNRLMVSDLYVELMKMKGYDDEFLAIVFDHLVQNDMLAMAFMAKSEKFRRISLDNFKKEKDLSFGV